MQRNFGPMRKQVEAWQRCELTDVTAKVVIYEAFVEGKLESPCGALRGGRRSFAFQNGEQALDLARLDLCFITPLLGVAFVARSWG